MHGLQYEVPYIDERVEHVGVSRLRTLNASNLRDFDKTLVIQDNDKPLAVLLSYEQFLAMQKKLIALLNTVEMLHNGKEPQALIEGIQSMKTPAKEFSEVKKSLKRHSEK